MKKKFQILLGLSLALILASCSSIPVDENDPVSLLQDAEEDIKSDHYVVAVEKLRSIKNKFPYSKYAVDAQLRLADVYYLQDSFPEAAAAYENFRDLHPNHEKASYAAYRVGAAFAQEIPSTVARDLAPAQKALDAYSEFIRRFPSAPETSDAKRDISSIRNKMAEKELYIANFYYHQKLYDSAKPRYKKVIELFSDTDVVKQAQEKLDMIELQNSGISTKKE